MRDYSPRSGCRRKGLATNSRTYKSVVATLTYLRRNRVQAEIAEAFAVSQSTISRAITTMTGLVERALRGYVPTADELDDRTQYVADGTLLP